MERTTLVFIALLVLLVVGYFYMKENFTDSSGSSIHVSLADLMAILASASSASSASPSSSAQQQRQQQPIVIMNSPSPSRPSPPSYARDASGNSDLTGAYLSMKNYILTDVKDSIGSQFSPLSSAFAGANGSSCQQQGNAFVQSIPGKSPADDYIRKDSIPCYACSLP